jgi:predicted DNA-binding ribbon-helix-helix protein
MVSGMGFRGPLMKSSVVKRYIVIDGHKTSVSLEDPFWADLKKVAHTRQVTLSELVTKIDGTREQSNLSSAIRLFVLHHFFPRLLLKQHPQASLSSSATYSLWMSHDSLLAHD